MNPALLQADLDAQVALSVMADYKPANEAFSLAKVAEALGNMNDARQSELLAQTTLDAARDAAAAAEWCFHDAIQGAKTQVIAQYGVNSDQVQALGLKKKSERKRPSQAVRPQPS
jgi:hypothetical protein